MPNNLVSNANRILKGFAYLSLKNLKPKIMTRILKNHHLRVNWLSIVVVCMTCLMTLSCNTENSALLFGDAIAVTIPEEFEYDSEKDTYSFDDCMLSVTYDSIMQMDEAMPLNNFNNTMNVVEPDKKLLHEEIIENDGLKVGLREVLDKQINIRCLIFVEIKDHLLLINCQYKNADREIYTPKVQSIISSIRPLG